MLCHLIDRFYVVKKFILPTIDDIRVSPITLTWIVQLDSRTHAVKCIPNMKNCSKIESTVYIYKKKVDY